VNKIAFTGIPSFSFKNVVRASKVTTKPIGFNSNLLHNFPNNFFLSSTISLPSTQLSGKPKITLSGSGFISSKALLIVWSVAVIIESRLFSSHSSIEPTFNTIVFPSSTVQTALLTISGEISRLRNVSLFSS